MAKAEATLEEPVEMYDPGKFRLLLEAFAYTARWE
jgi:hypothetical protein